MSSRGELVQVLEPQKRGEEQKRRENGCWLSLMHSRPHGVRVIPMWSARAHFFVVPSFASLSARVREQKYTEGQTEGLLGGFFLF